MKVNSKIVFLLVLICIVSLRALAQDPGGAPGDPDVPLDGGLSIALAAGIGYGAKRLLKRKNANTADKAKDTTEK